MSIFKVRGSIGGVEKYASGTKSTSHKESFMKRHWGMAAGASFVIILALLACQTAKTEAPEPAQSKIETEASGFSPNATIGSKTIEFALVFGNPDSVKSWTAQMTGDKGVQKVFSGDGSGLPSTITWDGMTDMSAPAPEGSYIAALSIDYGGKLAPVTARSRSFVLDATPPAATAMLSPGSFVPSSQGTVQPMTITVDAKSALAKIDSWTLDIQDSSGKLFRRFSIKWPIHQVTWDGKGLSGDNVQAGKTYTGVLQVRDEYGNTGRSSVPIQVAALPLSPQPQAAGTSSITASEAGFSPSSTNATMKFALVFAQAASVSSWKVEISQAGKAVQKSFTGSGAGLPQMLAWDGKSDAGATAPEGTYKATLSIDYDKAFNADSVSSAAFVLDATPPMGAISLSSAPFSPIKPTDTLTITIAASSPIAKIDSWSLDIFDPGGSLFKSFDGKWPLNQIVWDGKGINGDMVVSTEDYAVSVQIRDEFGNVGTVRGNIPIDILVLETSTGFRIPNSRIYFKPYTADYSDVPPDLAKQNAARLDRLAEMLRKFPDYKIRIVGHAVMIYWDNPGLGKVEQEKELIPLSKARAEAIKQALIDRGLKGDMIVTEGVGASDQLVPDSDYPNRWQNRRTAIFIERE
jgi:flagellar hook assembly protein FlgD